MRFNPLTKAVAVFGIVVLAVTAALVLCCPKDAEQVSMLDTACTFDGHEPGCMDSVASWNRGLEFYDSVLASSGDTLLAVRSLFWNFWDLSFAGMENAGDPNTILPLRLLEKKRSSCTGVVWLALMLREVRGIELNAYMLPGHVFFRVNGVNLEPNRAGFSYTDDEYRKKYAVDGRGVWAGYEFKPLQKRQFLGLIAFNLGNAELEHHPEKALAWYKIAGEFFPAFPGIEVNRKIALKRLSRHTP